MPSFRSSVPASPWLPGHALIPCATDAKPRHEHDNPAPASEAPVMAQEKESLLDRDGASRISAVHGSRIEGTTRECRARSTRRG
jgi:hypothetical protein